jgi:hypothetical protein
MTVEVAIMAAIMAGFIGFFFMFIRFWIEQGARRLQRKIRDALDIKSVGAAVAEVTVVESSLPWEPTEEERLAHEKADHDRYRKEKLEWHRDRLASWDADFERALPLSERPVIEVEEVDNDREPLYNDGSIVAWGGIKIYEGAPPEPSFWGCGREFVRGADCVCGNHALDQQGVGIHVPYLTVNEMRAIRSQELSRVEILEADYKAQMGFLLTYGSFDSYDSDGDQE